MVLLVWNHIQSVCVDTADVVLIWVICVGNDVGIGPSQDVHFFYRRSHLSAPQTCALIFSTNFQFIFTLNSALRNLVIELCSALKIIQFFTVN